MRKIVGKHIAWPLEASAVCAAMLLFFLGCAGVADLWAQTVFGRISGTVTDSSGASVPGAKVTITHEASGIARSVTTDDTGFYIATNLPVGAYIVTADAPGFQGGQRSGNQLVAEGR